MSEAILMPEDFRRAKYCGLWLDDYRHWDQEALTLLTAACDLKLSPLAAANTIGRSPKVIVNRALQESLRVPAEWSALVYRYEKKAPRINLNYPYVVKPDARHDDLLVVNRMVSKAMPGREDVCQDIMLALWQSRTSLPELRADPKALKSFARAFRKQAFERSGINVESMDVTLHHEGGDGRSKYEDARYGYTPDFSPQLIDDISSEEESLGVPAALWMRTSII